MFVASWRILLNLHPPQSVLWQAYIQKEKKQAEGEGAVTRKGIQVGERKGGRQAEKQRERAGVGNPPLHLLVIYSFMFSRRLERWLVFWCRHSSAYRPLCNPEEDKWWEHRRRQYKRKGVAPFWLNNFSRLPFLICQDRLLVFGFFFLSKRLKEAKHQPNQSLILFVHRIEALLSSIVDFSCHVKGLFSPSEYKHWKSLCMSSSPMTQCEPLWLALGVPSSAEVLKPCGLRSSCLCWLTTTAIIWHSASANAWFIL